MTININSWLGVGKLSVAADRSKGSADAFWVLVIFAARAST
jgi:hypothetical protein